MVLDTSAVIAVLQSEQVADRLITVLERADVLTISGASALEASIVLFGRYGDSADRELDLFLHRLDVDVVAVSSDQVDIARSAFRRFGRGQHPAGLNFGDCFSYALSKAQGEPLLFVGDDFAKTDVTAAPY